MIGFILSEFVCTKMAELKLVDLFRSRGLEVGNLEMKITLNRFAEGFFNFFDTY